MREITRFHLIFTICVPTIAKAILSSEKECTPALFPHHTDGEKECTPHCFSPPYRWRERVYCTPFPLQYGGNLKMYPTLFFPIVIRWEKECTPTLFFPIIEGKNIQRVNIYPNPSGCGV